LLISAQQAINGALSVRCSAPDDVSCVVWMKQQLSEAGGGGAETRLEHEYFVHLQEMLAYVGCLLETS